MNKSLSGREIIGVIMNYVDVGYYKDEQRKKNSYIRFFEFAKEQKLKETNYLKWMEYYKDKWTKYDYFYYYGNKTLNSFF